MSDRKTYNLFISHAWEYNEEYWRFVKLLNDAPYFNWRNYSVPEHDPLHTRTTKQLEEALRNQIRPVHVVVILSGMYVSYSYWIQKEIDIAIEMGKSILGVAPWGSQRVPKTVQDAAYEIVGWQTSSIVSAIRRLAP